VTSPNDASVARLVTAVVVEAHDEWAVAQRRYLSEESMAKLYAKPVDTSTDVTTEEAPLAVTA
jgi:putative transposase